METTQDLSTDRVPYELGELLYEDNFSQTYRGKFGRTREPKIIRVQKPEGKETSSMYFLNEFELGKLVNDPGILKPEDMFENSDGICLVYENIPSKLLHQSLAGSISLETFLEIALAITENLAKLHSFGIVHNQISPRAFFYNPDTGETKLAWLGGASLLLSEKGSYAPLRYTFDILPYCSPENTGRLNRPVDFRSDAYSLGALFYKMISGTPPFETEDPLEMVHYHIARSPVSLVKKREDVPTAISTLVDKLLSKMPEERYFSLENLIYDLKSIKDSLKSKRKLSEFVPGVYERKVGFRDSPRIYDRDRERKEIESGIVNVTNGKRSAIFIGGKSGTGKTALVEDAITYLDIYSVVLLRGKFEEDKKEIPYYAFRQIMDDLLRRILQKKEEEIILLKNFIKETLGDNIEILTQFLPDLGKTLGIEIPVKTNKRQKDEKILFAVALKFLTLCFDRKNPAIILVDDLQWADSASLALLEFILNSEDWEGLLFVLTSRSEDADFFPNINVKQSSIGLDLREIRLTPLNEHSVFKYISDSIHVSAEDANRLAEVLVSKTGGNPLFLHQFLRSLYEEGCLSFDPKTAYHRVDWDTLLQRAVTDNVLDLFLDKVGKLPDETLEVLRVGACIGAKFDLKDMYDFFKTRPGVLSRGIREAIREGIVFYRESGNMLFPALQYISQRKIEESGMYSSLSNVQFHFSHDRMIQSILDATDSAEKARIHNTLAKLLIDREKTSGGSEQILDIANHLLRSRELYTNGQENEDFFHYTILAGNSAKSGAAYESSYSFFSLLASQLKDSYWQKDRKNAIHILKSLAESAYYLSRREEAEKIVSNLLSKLNSPSEKADVYLMQLEVMNVFNDLDSASKIGIKALQSLGIGFKEKPGFLAVFGEVLKMVFYSRGRSPEKLVNAKDSKDPYKAEALNILVNLLNYGKHMDMKVMAYIYLKLINLTLKEGNAPFSFFGYAGFGSILLSINGNFQQSMRYWTLAEKILKKFKSDELYGRFVFGRTILLDYFMYPFRSIVDYTEEAFHKCMQYGDYLWAAFALFSQNTNQLYSAENSISYREKIRENLERGSKLNYDILMIMLHSSDSYLDRLEGKSTETVRYKDNLYTDQEFESKILESAGNGTANSWYATLFGSLAYLSGYYLEAERIFKKYHPDLEKSRIMFIYSEYRFYRSLGLLKLRKKKLKLTEKFFFRYSLYLFKLWSKIYPPSFQLFYFVLAGLYEDYAGRKENASEFFDMAMQQIESEPNDFRKAVIYQHIAEWSIKQGRTSYGKFLMQNAVRLYGSWGAKSIVNLLRDEYGELLRPQGAPKRSVEKILADSMLSTSFNLDLRTVLKASQSISGVIELGELLRQLIRTIMENAAATRGFLILPQNKELFLMAGSDIEEPGFLPKPISLDEAGHLLPLEVVYFCFRSGQKVLISDAAKDSFYSVNPYIKRSKPKSLLCMPITKQGRTLCVLYLENRLTAGIFDEHRLEILEILSAQAAISLENAKLYEDITRMNSELERKVNERTEELARSLSIIRKDMLYSQKIQRSILPELKNIPGLRYSVNYLPMDEVGGDFYDICKLSNGRYRFFLADATGHGVQAALVTMAIKGEYESLKSSLEKPGEILSGLNNSILNKYKTLYFTGAICDVDLSEKKVYFASAGHISQFLVRSYQTEEMPKTGAILGFVKDYPYRTEEYKIESGDRIFLFSDGIYEQFDEDKLEYGEERFVHSIRTNAQFEPQIQAERILSDLQNFISKSSIQDDITLLILDID
ncbi:trifunctional serine/threonine-protein kinase/ATP-binding protein/SpoIIE family protein phosphatase [Leptospira andrefontaineae]|uniref:GAF domain-containing protein n=1 Tax=Leptospira andrefontaineae TaxID=2484976 RepID=A0A4R9H6Z7_9LEPT|nr:trifunctional serine/threonine-protein kinase/ATP-binding protein/SpoIIE family protein phosphatase [Leptospira andrefontaineae]TGK41384.1 GAF domain-containing protein [Leptospira andrefontaineae]